MVDHPILFSAPMIRALLAGRKTQTRRLLKPQLYSPESVPSVDLLSGKWMSCEPSPITGGMRQMDPWRKLRYVPDNRVWVKESWRIGAWRTYREDRSGGRGDFPIWGKERHDIAVDYLADNYPRKEWLGCDDDKMMQRFVDQSRQDAAKDGRFTAGSTPYEYRWSPGQSPCRSRVSIYMPRWASRLTLTVTYVRVQRLQDISEADAMSEGCLMDGNMPAEIPHKSGIGDVGWDFARDWYADLWDEINGPEAWAANPWVAAYSFTVHRQNIDAGRLLDGVKHNGFPEVQ